MAQLTTACLPPDDEEAVLALLQRALAMSEEARAILLQRLTTGHQVLTHNHTHDHGPVAGRQADKLNALRKVARSLGHPPSTTEYNAARSAANEPMPSISAIVKAFDGWAHALIAAGLMPNAPANAYLHRLNYVRQKAAVYKKSRLIECLQACARAIDRTPMVRDYRAWREEMMKRTTCDRDAIPHLNTIRSHFGTWDEALAAAGLPSVTAARTATLAHAPLPEVAFELPRGRPCPYPQARLRECLRSCASAVGRTPTRALYARWRQEVSAASDSGAYAIPSQGTFEAQFGTWHDALVAAGLPTYRRSHRRS